MIDLNMKSLTHMTKLFLPGMIEQKYGRIMNLASTAAFQPGPGMAVYFATKAYVLSFSEAISHELLST
jgi:short-subunit dehydrogenase